MRRGIGKYLIGGGIAAGALGYLAYAGSQSSWVYYVDVDQFVAEGVTPGQRARIHGVVSDAHLEVHRAELRASFRVRGKQHEVPVLYHGTIPDLFRAGRQVVVEGALDPRGVFQADVLLTKCSSKYESREALRPAEDAR